MSSCSRMNFLLFSFTCEGIKYYTKVIKCNTHLDPLRCWKHFEFCTMLTFFFFFFILHIFSTFVSFTFVVPICSIFISNAIEVHVHVQENTPHHCSTTTCWHTAGFVYGATKFWPTFYNINGNGDSQTRAEDTTWLSSETSSLLF